jgi:predicted TIM-barrel fold metal-dependent hydrolase
MKATLIALVCIGSTSALAQRPPAPIIDMHLHAGPADAQGPPPVRICAPIQRMATRDPGQSPEEYAAMSRQQRGCLSPLISAGTDSSLLEETLEVLRRRNIYAVTSGPWEWVQRWHAAAPDRVIQGLTFHVYNAPIDSIRQLVESGQLMVMGEVVNQLVGVAPGDSTFEPYLALAEARDIPVGIHIGPGPQGAFYRGLKGYRASLAHPQLLEEVLLRHPKLRIYVMHAGWPMLDEMLLMLYSHPQLYVDLGLISFALPRAEFHFYLRRLVQAGFGERIMFGSDQMVWPQAIDRAIAAVDSAPFLTSEQRRNIFYNNAARFLRLSEDEVARHHGARPRGRR